MADAAHEKKLQMLQQAQILHMTVLFNGTI